MMLLRTILEVACSDCSKAIGTAKDEADAEFMYDRHRARHHAKTVLLPQTDSEQSDEPSTPECSP